MQAFCETCNSNCTELAQSGTDVSKNNLSNCNQKCLHKILLRIQQEIPALRNCRTCVTALAHLGKGVRLLTYFSAQTAIDLLRPGVHCIWRDPLPAWVLLFAKLECKGWNYCRSPFDYTGWLHAQGQWASWGKSGCHRSSSFCPQPEKK